MTLIADAALARAVGGGQIMQPIRQPAIPAYLLGEFSTR